MTTANIPMQPVGPLKIMGDITADVQVPLATYETPLWPSTNRGARVTAAAGGIRTILIDDRMTRSIVLETQELSLIKEIMHTLQQEFKTLQQVAAQKSQHLKLLAFNTQAVGNLLYIRCEFTTGDASGHNMTTQGAEHILQWLLARYPALTYVSISGNFCADKKNSAANGLLGRGKYVIAESTISRKLCQRYLRTTPEKMAALNLKKNLMGSQVAGSLRSANSHFANILLAFYLATGQDAANIVEGSQGFTHSETRADNLYFSVTLPNIIVGTVGNGKQHGFVQENLSQLGCLEKRAPGENAQRLALIIAATVLCGELSCLAAQTNPGELIASHLRLERGAYCRD